MSAVPGTPTNNGGKEACAHVLKNQPFCPSGCSLGPIFPTPNSNRYSDEICGLKAYEYLHGTGSAPWLTGLADSRNPHCPLFSSVPGWKVVEDGHEQMLCAVGSGRRRFRDACQGGR